MVAAPRGHPNRNHLYPVAALCQLLDLPRSSYYYQPVERDDALLRQAIESIAAEFPTYGSRRITQQLRRPPYQMVVNRKQIQRLMGEMGLKRPLKRGKQRTTNSVHGYPRFPNLVMDLSITYPNQVWVSDITYVRLRQDFVYLAVVMDVFTRAIRGWHLHRWLDQTLTLTALRQALVSHTPAIHHSDQGVQYAAHEYVLLLRRHDVQISMADVGKAWQNGYAERLMRTIKEEEVYLADYHDFADAYAQIGQFIEQVYQRKRIGYPLGAALGYLTPAEFEVNWKQQQQQPLSDTPSLIVG
jgi:putative transposase